MKYSKYFGAKWRGFIKSESFWRQRARVKLSMKISGVILVYFCRISFTTKNPCRFSIKIGSKCLVKNTEKDIFPNCFFNF
jgi:hypothetical protein